MLSVNHAISCVHLTLAIMEDIIGDSELNSNDIQLISPMGNMFTLGDIDKVEIYEIDEQTVEYKIIDACDTTRTITFAGGNSAYAVLLGADGYLRDTTGVEPPTHADRATWGDWHRAEIGLSAAPGSQTH